MALATSLGSLFYDFLQTQACLAWSRNRGQWWRRPALLLFVRSLAGSLEIPAGALGPRQDAQTRPESQKRWLVVLTVGKSAMSTSVGAPGSTFGEETGHPSAGRGPCPGKASQRWRLKPSAGFAACREGSLAGPARVQERGHSHCVPRASVACTAGRGRQLQKQARALHLLGAAVQRLVGSTSPGAGGLVEPGKRVDTILRTQRGACQAFWVSRHCDGCGGG